MDVEQMNELALFAGAGGGILGGHLLGWRTICSVEWDAYAASVLLSRQNDGVLPPFPIWDDVQTFDGRPWRGRVDVISGGFPCQDISAAGKGAGITGEKSGMWFHMARIVGEVRPEYVFVENSPMLTTRGLGTVLGDLASLGYDARWGVLGAVDVGAPHQRDRIWIVAYSKSHRYRKGREAGNIPETHGRQDGSMRSIFAGTSEQSQNMAHASRQRLEGHHGSIGEQEKPRAGSDGALANAQDSRDVWRDRIVGTAETEHHDRGSEGYGSGEWWHSEPDVGRVVNGVAARVDRLKAIGNGQVPTVAATAWRLLK
jgi:DNA (cytosine-5)-methyltransferase 1